MSFNGRSLELSSGTSYKSALSAYRQAVKSLQFTGLCGSVHMYLTVERQAYGGFTTEIDPAMRLRCTYQMVNASIGPTKRGVR